MHDLRIAASLVLAVAVAACGGKSSEGGAPSASASAAAAATPPAASTPAPATASAAPSTTASAAESAEAEDKAGAVHIHLDGAKVLKGKAEGAEKVLKSQMLRLRTTCIRRDVKKEGLDGTLKVTIEVGKDGKPEKIVTHAQTGKVSEEVATCVKTYYEKHLELDTAKNKATVEVMIAMGPKVQPDK
jgi:hypothetical protein